MTPLIQPMFQDWALLLYAWVFLCLALACSDEVEGPSNDDPWHFEEHYPAIVAPDAVDLGEVAFGDEASETFAVENVGQTDLEIRGWTVTAPFELAAPAGDDVIVEPDESVQFEVRLTAEATEEVDLSTQLAGAVELESNDPDTPKHNIEVESQVSVPCLEMELDDVYDFDEAPRDATSMEVVELRNCDEETMLFVEIVDMSGDEAFSAALGGLTGDGAATVEPGGSVELWLIFRPETPEPKETTVHLSSNDPSSGEFSVDLTGQGAPYECIEPIIEAQASADPVSSTEESVLNAAVLDTVTLDASHSYDPTPGQLEAVEWSLIDAPDDSGALLEDDSDSMTNELFLDLAGTYVVELDAVNDEGEWACTPARLTIESLVGSDIHVQLVWDTPGDPERHNDHGTDLDLHFLHPDGQWDHPPYDCNWQNPEPQWHDGEEYGNPTLDIDATQGWGPENINLDDPEPDVDYAVGVNYFTDRDYGPSIATVRIFFEGVLHTELTSPAFETGQFWDALRVVWDPEEVEVIDEIYHGFPE